MAALGFWKQDYPLETSDSDYLQERKSESFRSYVLGAITLILTESTVKKDELSSCCMLELCYILYARYFIQFSPNPGEIDTVFTPVCEMRFLDVKA